MVTETSPRRWLEEAALNRRWFDVIIFAGGKQYRAHKIILSAASPFLRGILLSRSFDEYSSIVLPDVSSQTVELLLQYMYTGEVSLLQDQVESFITLAKALQLHIDKDMVCEDKHKHCEIDPASVNHPRTGNSVLLNILSDVHSVQKHSDKENFKSEEIKHESNTSKIFDVETLIKSDKISKCSMNDNGKDFATRQNSLLSEKYPKICEFYKKMQYYGRNYYETKDSKLKSEVNDVKLINDVTICVDDECRSTSSCEVIDPVSDNVTSSNTRYGESFQKNDKLDTTPYRQTKQRGYLSPRISPSNDASQNTLIGLQRSPDSQNCTDESYRSELDCRRMKADEKERYHEVNSRLQEEHVASFANHRLIKPIPSLMPIDRLSVDQNLRTSPVLLDLSAVKRKLNRNVHSAFQEVSKSYLPNDTQHNNVYHNNYTNHYQVNSNSLVPSAFHVQNSSLRINNSYQTDNLINTTGDRNCNSNQHPTSDRLVPQDLILSKTKILPRNRAISGPWCSRSPTFYKPGRRTPISPQKYSHDVVDSPRNTRHVVQSYTPQEVHHSIEKSILNVSERSNDSNNNFDTINCNNTSAIPKTYHQLGERSEEELNGIYNKQLLVSNNSPRSLSVTSSRDEDVFKTPEDEYRNILDFNNKYNHQPIIEQFSIVQNVLDPELSVKTEDCIVNDCEQLVLKCEFCAKVFTSKESLAIHSGSHSSRARYKCDQCDKCFSQLRNYKYHVSVHRGTKEFAATCNVCGKYFNDRGYLSSHMKIHRNRKEYQCPHCPKSFNQRVAYNMHVRIHTGIKPHQCEECGKAFSRKMLLKQHARTHSGEKPYACTSCGKRFADRSNMTLHMRLHSGVKPFSCTLCPKSFTKKHHLKTHLNYHTGNKPYACVKCGLTFSQSSNMRTHMKKCTLPGPTNLHPVIQPELMAT